MTQPSLLTSHGHMSSQNSSTAPATCAKRYRRRHCENNPPLGCHAAHRCGAHPFGLPHHNSEGRSPKINEQRQRCTVAKRKGQLKPRPPALYKGLRVTPSRLVAATLIAAQDTRAAPSAVRAHLVETLATRTRLGPHSPQQRAAPALLPCRAPPPSPDSPERRSAGDARHVAVRGPEAKGEGRTAAGLAGTLGASAPPPARLLRARGNGRIEAGAGSSARSSD